MKISVIDGQGGKIGALIVEKIKSTYPTFEVTAVGTNTIATSAMLKAGADKGATGENPVVVTCQTADVIIGPIGILCADALLGEITEKMAVSIGRSHAKKILIPFGKCNVNVAGADCLTAAEYVEKAVAVLEDICR